VLVLLPCGDENDFLVDSTDAPGLAFDMEGVAPDYLHHPKKTSAHLHLHSDNDRDADARPLRRSSSA
jgi:hypothetical protein